MEKYKISKEKSMEIKGIGILLMLLHHFFTFPDWYVKDYGFNLSSFSLLMREPTKICVAIFAFLTGWALCIKTSTMREIIKKIEKFLMAYWVVYIPLLIASILVGYCTSLKNIILEAFGLHVPIMIFCWYIYFYIVSIILIFITRKMIDKSVANAIVVGILCPMIGFFVLKKLFAGSLLDNLFYHLAQWYPCISMGYIINKYNFFSYLKKAISGVSRRMGILFGTMFFTMFLRQLFDKLDFIYVIFFAFSVSELLDCASSRKIGKYIKTFLMKWGGGINVCVVHTLRFLFRKLKENIATYNIYLWTSVN